MTAERALRKILFLGCCVLEKESMSSFARSLKPSVSHTSIASVLDGKIKSRRISAALDDFIHVTAAKYGLSIKIYRPNSGFLLSQYFPKYSKRRTSHKPKLRRRKNGH